MIVIILVTLIQLCSNVLAANFVSLDAAPVKGVNHIAPVFDFDGDGCYPAAGVSRLGEMNPGLETSGSLGGGCRTSNFLAYSNTLHRQKCIYLGTDKYCGHFYSLYFEKDQVIAGIDWFGHRHDWEQAAVWTKNDVVTHGSVSAHGDMETKPISEIPRNGKQIKVVYHKDGITTHALRFAKINEIAENSYGQFVTPPIISWSLMKGDGVSNSELKRKLNTFNYGSATIPLKDSNFLNNLNRFKPPGYPHFFADEDSVFTNWFSEEGTGTEICPDNRVVTGIECQGRYCDNKRLKCSNIPDVVPSGAPYKASVWISDGNNNTTGSNYTVLVGLECDGRYCDNLRAIYRSHYFPTATWTDAFSEEQGLGKCPGVAYVSGLQCSGRYCDNLRLRCQQTE